MSGWGESEFREYVRAQVMYEPDEKRCGGFVEAIAEEMGISRWTLYDILKGRVDLSPDRLPALCNAVRRVAPESDIPRRLLAWIVSRCEGFALREMAEHREPDGEIEDNVDALTLAVMEIFKAKVEALKDGVLDEREREKIYLKAIKLWSETDALLAELKPLALRRPE